MTNNLTEAVLAGADVRSLILAGARHIDVLQCLADLPADAPIPDHIPADRGAEQRVKALMLEIADLEALPDTELELRAASAFQKAKEAMTQMITKAEADLQVYNGMLSQVQAWTPPTPSHEGLKKHLVDSLTAAIHVECLPPASGWPTVVKLSGTAWRGAMLRDLGHELEAAEKAQAHEDAVAEFRNKWVKALKASLPGSGQA